MNMGRLVSVAGEEEQSIRATLKDGRTHMNDSANFSDSPPLLIDGPVNDGASAAPLHDRAGWRRLQPVNRRGPVSV
jgi:hypothetical protein